MHRRKFIALLAGVAALPAGFIAALGKREPEIQTSRLTSAELDRMYDALHKSVTMIWQDRWYNGWLEAAGVKA